MEQSPRRSLELRSPPKAALRLTLSLLSLPMLVLLLVPLIALFLRISPAQVLASLSKPQALQSIYLSAVTTSTSTLLIILFGLPLAYSLARRMLPFPRLIDTLVDLPIVLPPAVAGVALLLAFGRRGLLGDPLNRFGIQIAFTTLAVILAQIFIAAPFFIKSAVVGLAGIDVEMEQAAGLDGANAWQAFRYVVLPLAWPALLSGAILAWARALGEFGATIIFAGNLPGRTQTMPLAIYIGFELDLSVAITLSVILVCFSFLALFLTKQLLGGRVITPNN